MKVWLIDGGEGSIVYGVYSSEEKAKAEVARAGVRLSDTYGPYIAGPYELDGVAEDEYGKPMEPDE